MTELEYQKLRLIIEQFDFDEDVSNPQNTVLIGLKGRDSGNEIR